jgi:hypothetical protein
LAGKGRKLGYFEPEQWRQEEEEGEGAAGRMRTARVSLPRLEMIREPTRTAKEGMDGLIGRSGPAELRGFGISGPWPFKCAVMSFLKKNMCILKKQCTKFFQHNCRCCCPFLQYSP